MTLRLSDHLNTLRRQRLVGRVEERNLFQHALTAEELPFHVLYVFGPGGIGKTTLLREFRYMAEQTQVPAVYLDARDVEPTPDSFVGALQSAMHLNPNVPPVEALASVGQRNVIVVDTCETLAPLDGWLREVFLPQLADNVLVVLASPNPLSPGWHADPGWQSLVRILPLHNFSPEESRTYLQQRGVPPEKYASVLDFTHGHPLALSLVADLLAQRPDTVFQPEAAPDVIKALLERLVQKVPGPAHRAAARSLCAGTPDHRSTACRDGRLVHLEGPVPRR